MTKIADAIIDPEIERITLIKRVRVGVTTLPRVAVDTYVAH